VKTCIDCQAGIEELADFPGPRCLTCWTPIGEAQFQTMTAEDLAHMWGAPKRKKDNR